MKDATTAQASTGGTGMPRGQMQVTLWQAGLYWPVRALLCARWRQTSGEIHWTGTLREFQDIRYASP